MAINPADFGREWQNAQIAALPQQAQLQFNGQGNVLGYNPSNIDAHMQSLQSFLGPSLNSLNPSAQFSEQNMNALGMFFPNIKNFDMGAINRTVTDVKSPFSPYYFGVSAEGYQAPKGKKGPGGVVFNSGLGKTNENPGDYKTPGAGLWAAGFDLNDPLLVQKLYDHFGKNRGEVWSKYAPKKLDDGAWRKASPQETLAFVSDADEFFRKEALKMDLPKRGIMDSLAGQLITGALIGAATGGFGSIVGGLSGSSALGNLASLAANTAIGGAQGGWGGALTSALGGAVGAGVDQAGGLGNIGDFLADPLGSIGAAYGLGNNAFAGLNLSGMGEAAQIGPGSLAQVTPPSSIGQNVISTDYPGGIPHETIEVIAEPIGDIPQIGGGGFGSTLGGAAGSALGSLLSGNAVSGTGPVRPGGLLATGPAQTGTPGKTSGQTQTSQNNQTPIFIPGFGNIGPNGLPTGAPGPYSDAYQAGGSAAGGDSSGGMESALGAALGAGTGLLSAIGPAGTAASGTGFYSGTGVGGVGAGGDGLGGDGLGGDGLGGDGLGLDGMGGGGGYMGLLSGGTPGSMGDILDVMQAQSFGAAKKKGQSFYSPVKSPKRRRGITLRRAS